MTHTLRLLNWNLEWAKPNSKRGRILLDTIVSQKPDIICITEGYLDLLPVDGHLITSTADYGYKLVQGRRKVLLWSKNSWRHVMHAEHGDMPTGRYAEGVTDTILGKVRVVGVCIPRSHAHVNTGQKIEKHGKTTSGILTIWTRLSLHVLTYLQLSVETSINVFPVHVPLTVSITRSWR